MGWFSKKEECYECKRHETILKVSNETISELKTQISDYRERFINANHEAGRWKATAEERKEEILYLRGSLDEARSSRNSLEPEDGLGLKRAAAKFSGEREEDEDVIDSAVFNDRIDQVHLNEFIPPEGTRMGPAGTIFTRRKGEEEQELEDGDE